MKLYGILLRAQMVEDALRLLRKLQLLNYGYEFHRTERSVLVPLLREPSDAERTLIRGRLGDIKIQQALFTEAIVKPRKLHDYFRGQVPNDLISKIPRSFDIIGDIAILELPRELESFSSAIGNGLLKVNPHLRLVLKKSSDIAGTFRTRKFEVIAGVGSTETFYNEFSCRFHLDVATVYFNPRLAHERMRVARQVEGEECVADMFAGVGPYSILIAKQKPESKVYSVDINPAAIKYLKENALTNGVADRVIPMLGDAMQLAGKELRGIANRIVMNLPSEAKKYMGAAAQILKKEGAITQFYTFAGRNESVEIIRESFRSAVQRQNRKVESFRFCKVIKEVASSRVQLAVDAFVK